jgi:hypothetical protein
MAPTKLTWSNLGPIRANMVLDHIPNHAGVYKLTFKLWGNTYTYIGEAGARGLRARIADYANHPPAEGNKVEHLLRDLLREAGEADLLGQCRRHQPYVADTWASRDIRPLYLQSRMGRERTLVCQIHCSGDAKKIPTSLAFRWSVLACSVFRRST